MKNLKNINWYKFTIRTLQTIFVLFLLILSFIGYFWETALQIIGCTVGVVSVIVGSNVFWSWLVKGAEEHEWENIILKRDNKEE